jgi:TPR repeat protein
VQLNIKASGQFSLLEQAHQASCMEEDYVKARQLYEEAAEQGDIEAMFYLGLMYRDGRGVQQDVDRARVLFQNFVQEVRRAANRDDPIASFRLGKMLQYGDPVIKDETEALRWITRAAEKGLAEAQFHLSRLYAYGWCGVRQDAELEEHWLTRAAEAEYGEALYLKGVADANVYFESGNSHARDSARLWLQRAATADYADAAALLEKLS